MHDTSMFRTVAMAFVMFNFVDGLTLFKTTITPVTFGNIVVTVIGVEIEPSFSKTTVVVFVVVEEPEAFVVVTSSVSVKYVSINIRHCN